MFIPNLFAKQSIHFISSIYYIYILNVLILPQQFYSEKCQTIWCSFSCDCSSIQYYVVVPENIFFSGTTMSLFIFILLVFILHHFSFITFVFYVNGSYMHIYRYIYYSTLVVILNLKNIVPLPSLYSEL